MNGPGSFGTRSNPINPANPAPQSNNTPNNAPQFKMDYGEGWGKKIALWLKNNWSIIVPVILIIIISGAIYLATQRTSSVLEDLENSENSTATTTENNAGDLSELDINESDQGINPLPRENSEVANASGIYTLSAQRGEGVTHVARRALIQYLEDNPDASLTKEHKIYIEDYIQNRVGEDMLEIGDQVEISASLIQEAMASAKNLNDSQLRNLEQYSLSSG